MRTIRLAWFGAAALMVACGSSHSPEDGGASGRDGMVTRDDGGEACGPTTCAAGQVCCNASCGICVEPGGSCIDLACEDAGVTCGGASCGATELCCSGCGGEVFCAGGPVCPDVSCPVEECTSGEDCGAGEYCDQPGATCAGAGLCTPRPEGCPEDCPGVCGCDGRMYCNDCMAAAAGVDVSEGDCAPPPTDCSPQDVASEGTCRRLAGWGWNGVSCETIVCRCRGTQCDELFASEDACRAAYAECMGATCGGFAGMTCGPREWCDFPEGAFCGAADESGVCRARPDGCPDVYDPVCGCDGVTYGNGCEANAAGTDAASRGPC